MPSLRSAVAVLDLGKTNAKVALFEDGAMVFQRSVPSRARPGPPYPHIDVEAQWAFFLEALGEAAREHSGITDIIVTTHGASAALVDDKGLVLPVMDYEFDGVDAVEPDYAALRPPFAETFSPPLGAGLTVGRQLFYQMQRYPSAFAQARHILPLPQYVGWRLTGRAASEVTSLGCHADLWRPLEGRPSSLVERLGWERLMPSVLPAHAVLGPLRPDIAERSRLPQIVRVRVGIHDSNASLLPHLATTAPPFTLISTGTWVVIMAVGGDPGKLDATKDMSASVDVEGRAVPTAKFMGGREFATILDGAPAEADEADLAAVLGSGVLALPAFAPEGGPFAGRKGEVVGALPDRPGARAALASLYMALMIDLLLDNLGAAGGPLIVEGSLARNRLACGLLAVFRSGQPILASFDETGTAFGASLLATWPEAPKRAAPQTVAPLADATAALAGRTRWRRLVA
jgi:sugar (pentulose or hexulose) kinase